jgi:hypothetical protein
VVQICHIFFLFLHVSAPTAPTLETQGQAMGIQTPPHAHQQK